MLTAAIRHTFCGSSTILDEIGFDRDDVTMPIIFELRPRQILAKDHPWKLRFEVACDA